MDYQKATKSDLIIAINTLEVEKTQLTAARDHNAAVANWFQKVIESIEEVLLNSPFINKEGKFFKKLTWILLNLGTIKVLIEEVVSHVKKWREEVETIKKQIEKQSKDGNA